MSGRTCWGACCSRCCCCSVIIPGRACLGLGSGLGLGSRSGLGSGSGIRRCLSWTRAAWRATARATSVGTPEAGTRTPVRTVRGGRRGKLACAPGAYSAREAGTRGPYVPHGGPGAKQRARVSVGLHFLSATTVAGEHSPSAGGGSRGALESEEARRRSSSVEQSARITCARGGHNLRSRRAGGWRRAHPTLRVWVRVRVGGGVALCR